MTDAELEEIEARLRMVTGEKWYRSADADEVVQLAANRLSSTDTVEYYSRDIPPLIAEVRRLREIIKKKDEALKSMQKAAQNLLNMRDDINRFAYMNPEVVIHFCDEALAIGTDEKK